MPLVLTTCINTCGAVYLPSREVTVMENPEYGGSISFICPECDELTVRPMTKAKTAKLRAGGVPITTWTTPAEMREPKQGAPLTTEDALRFHNLLRKQAR